MSTASFSLNKAVELELRNIDGNNVSDDAALNLHPTGLDMILIHVVSIENRHHVIARYYNVGVLRLREQASAMGVGIVRDIHVSGLQRTASRSRSAHQLCSLRHYGQLERQTSTSTASCYALI